MDKQHMSFKRYLWFWLLALIIMAIACYFGWYWPTQQQTTELSEESSEESPFIVMPKDLSEQVFGINSSGELTFYENGEVIGELKHLDDGTFIFIGQTDASAHRFFEVWEGIFREQLDAICSQREEYTFF